MSQTPNPLNQQNLSRATLIAIALAVAGIIFFIALWIVLGTTGVDQVTRLLLSLCLPPGLIAIIIGGYFLLVQPKKKEP